MPDFFQLLANELLQLHDYTVYTSPAHGDFGFKYMKNYSGLMAKPLKRYGKLQLVGKKQGLFDITILTGTRYPSGVTHRMLFDDLVRNSKKDTCLEVWKGVDVRQMGLPQNETEVLLVMALLMFEQEVNWGGERLWQRYSFFSPFQTSHSRCRPRDMLMGFILQCFDLGIDNVKWWMRIKPGTAFFRSDDPLIKCANYEEYPDDYKRYFSSLGNTPDSNALMVGDYRKRFRDIANVSPDNPNLLAKCTDL